MTDTLTPEKREEIAERIRLALRAVRSSEWPDTAMPVFKVLEKDVPALESALDAAIERAEKAEADRDSHQRVAIAAQTELTALKARVAELETENEKLREAGRRAIEAPLDLASRWRASHEKLRPSNELEAEVMDAAIDGLRTVSEVIAAQFDAALREKTNAQG